MNRVLTQQCDSALRGKGKRHTRILRLSHRLIIDLTRKVDLAVFSDGKRFIQIHNRRIGAGQILKFHSIGTISIRFFNTVLERGTVFKNHIVNRSRIMCGVCVGGTCIGDGDFRVFLNCEFPDCYVKIIVIS